jgi:hypothetical protein
MAFFGSVLWQRFCEIIHVCSPQPKIIFTDTTHICSVHKFHLAVQRECARADRNKQGFSLVVFDVGEQRGADSLVEKLLISLQKRLRSTDEMGWFDKNFIGIILYATPIKEDALVFSHNIWHSLKISTTEKNYPKCSVYSYPIDWRNIKKAH